jgi:hypothetical protein
MTLLRDFALFVLPVLVAAGGWLYALSLRKQAGSCPAGEGKRVPAA